MQKFLKVFLFICCFVFSKQNYAQDIQAGWIDYKWISGYTYSINLTLLLDSSTVSTNNNLAVYFGDGDSVTISSNTFSSSNVLKQVYSTTHTYPGPSYYNVYANSVYRVNNIKNIPNSGSKSMFLCNLLSIDPFLGANTSPTPTNYPIIASGIGSSVIYNPGMTDIDGDSLSYLLVNCAASPTVSTYIPASSSVNSSNGAFTYQADTMGLYAFRLQVKEWRKNLDGIYQLIGTSDIDFVLDVDAGVGIKELDKKETISLYPNPTSNILNIKTNSKTSSEIEITNQLGQIVLKQKNSESVDVSKLVPGVYFIRINNSYSKFIKE